jgi:hypothetical protein
VASDRGPDRLRTTGWSAGHQGWLPVALAFLAGWLVLTGVGVSSAEVLVFTAYVAVALVLPGTLLWRLVAGDRPRLFVADLVCGAGLAYAVELFTYLLSRWIGHPRLVMLWPVVVVGLSLLPRWRARAWRPANTERAPALWSWAMTGIVAVAVAFLTRDIWRVNPISPTGLRYPYVDQPYHLSLVAELREHFPISSPTVAGQPLYYHWFVHAEIAATSWVTGIDPEVLLDRLSLLPMTVLVLLGAAVLARSLTRSSWLALLAPALLVTGGLTVDLLGGASFLTPILYISPTNTFAQALLVPALAMLLPMIRSARVPTGREWVALALLLAALSGAKATILPILLGGCVGAFVLGALVRRRIQPRLLVLSALTGVIWLAATETVYGGGSRSLVVDPLVYPKVLATQTGVAAHFAQVATGSAAAVGLLFLVSQYTYAAGVLGAARRRIWRDPGLHFLVTAAIAGAVATYTFSALGLSQAYFLRMTPLFVALASVWGLGELLPRRPERRVVVALCGCAALGAALAAVVHRLDERGTIGTGAIVGSPTGAGVGRLAEPYLLVGVGVACFALLVRVLVRPRGLGRRAAVAATAALVLGLGAPSSVSLAGQVLRHPDGPAWVQPPAAEATIDVGGLAAARWLRAHSTPGQPVATNQHCRADHGKTCDARQFWLAAYSERQVFIEGWSYEDRSLQTAQARKVSLVTQPFWDPARLAANDDAFLAKPGAVQRLRDQYGVQWLVVDERAPNAVAALRSQATVRFSSGEYVVLQIR